MRYATTAGGASSVPWTGITDKPASYPPNSHNHDDLYIRKSNSLDTLDGYLKTIKYAEDSTGKYIVIGTNNNQKIYLKVSSVGQ